MSRTVDCTPHWPNLLAYFERVLKEQPRNAKIRKGRDEVRDYIKRVHDSGGRFCPKCGRVQKDGCCKGGE